MEDVLRRIDKVFGEVLPEQDRVMSFREFVLSEEGMNLEGIYPEWFKVLDARLSEGGISRVVFRGSLGGGKSTIMNLVFLYEFYRLLVKSGGNIVKELGLMEGTEVYGLYFSVSKVAASQTGFAQMRNFVDRSPWFRKHYPRRGDIDSTIEFPGINFSITFASKESHAIGKNVWGFILDEANFRKGVGEGSLSEFDEVYQLAEQLETRLSQRFLRGGEEKFFAGYISSASYETAFIQERGESLKGNPKAIVYDAVLYKLDPGRYLPGRFEVFLGWGDVPPQVVTSEEQRLRLEKGLVGQDPGKFFEKVPEELRERFEGNIYLAIQNICGVPTGLKGSFVTNYELIRGSYRDDWVSPFYEDEVVVSNQDSVGLEVNLRGGFESPEKPHSLFLDLSLRGDYGALSCVRWDGVEGGVKYHSHVFTLFIVPPKFPAAVDVTKVQNFVISLAREINVVAFGSDAFGSVQLRQEVSKELGLPDVRVSLDSTDVPHLLWLNALASHRFRMIRYDRLDREIREAEWDSRRRRVIKRTGSSDDAFQTLVGAFFLSDSVGSSEGVIPRVVNVVNGRQVEAMLQGSGYQFRDARGVERRMRDSYRDGVRSASRLNKFLDKLGGDE